MATKKYFKENKVYVPELFEAISSHRGHKEREEILIEYAGKDKNHYHTLRCVMECIFHPDIAMDLPEGDPPFNAQDVPDYPFAGNNLFNVVKKIKRLIPQSNTFIPDQIKRERFFIRLLEGLHPKEAEVLLMMKDKKIRTYNGITDNLVRRVFPDWIPERPKAKDTALEGNSS